MKKFYFLLLFISINCFSTETFQSYILTTTGIKISIKANSFRVDSTEKIIYYKEINSEIENKMKFKDLDFILIGKNKFKTYKLSTSNELNGYFVLAHNTSNTLIVSFKYDEDDTNLIFYFFYIIDSNSNVVDSLKFDNRKNSKSSIIRADIYPKISYYFASCKSLQDRLSSFDNTSFENLNLDILRFFDTPYFIECI